MLRAELKVIGGKQHGSLIPLQAKKFLVGREQDCQLRPTSESVSRHHCVFSIDDFGIRLRDLGSTNGTFVNGERVQGQVVLQPNDRILIGKLEFEIVIEGVAQAVQHARVASNYLSDSGTGFMLSDLAEAPESSDIGSQTMLDTGPTEILGGAIEGSGETRVLSAESTQVTSPAIPVAPQEAPATDDLPVFSPEATPGALTVPLAMAQPVTQMQPIVAPMPPGMPMAPQGMPVPGMQPYGMPGMMPPGYPQPQYMQAPYANYAPQYMPNPYGMQPQPFMQQPYGDPAYQQQMAYQQQLAQQQQLAHQQAMMAAQYAAPQADFEPEPEEEAVAINSTVAPPTKLPPPEETGAKAPPPPPVAVPAAEGQPAAPPQVKPNQLAADIIKKYMNRG